MVFPLKYVPTKLPNWLLVLSYIYIYTFFPDPPFIYHTTTIYVPSPLSCPRDTVCILHHSENGVQCHLDWAATKYEWNHWCLLCQHLWPQWSVWDWQHTSEGVWTHLHMHNTDSATGRWHIHHHSSSSQLWWEPERTWEWTCHNTRYIGNTWSQVAI